MLNLIILFHLPSLICGGAQMDGRNNDGVEWSIIHIQSRCCPHRFSDPPEAGTLIDNYYYHI